MSAEEFWKDDPQLFVSYRTFYINKRKQEIEEMDYKCWLEGLYIHNGNGILVKSLEQVLKSMFGGKKSQSKLEEYPKKPYLEKQKEIIEKQSKEYQEKAKKEKYDNFQSSIVYIGTMKKRYLESIKNKEKINDMKGE